MAFRASGRGPETRLDLLGSILENANDAMLVTEAHPIDEPGPRVVYINAAFTAMTGYSPEEIVGESPRLLQGPQTDRAKLDEIRAALKKEEPIRTEVLNYRKDGETFWVELDIVPVGGGEGRPTHYVSVQRETTQRVVAEEERFHAMVQHAPDVVTLLDSDGKVLYESPSIERVTGRRPGELVGENAFDYVHPEDREWALGIFAGVVREGGDIRTPIPYRFLHKDGSWVHLEATGSNRLDDPSVGTIVVNSRDVTERVEAERKMAESEERFRTAFEEASTAVALISLDNRYLRVNRAMCEMLGYTGEELTEKRSFDITHPEDVEKSRERSRRMLTEGEPDTTTIEKRFLRRDGEVVWAISDVSLVRDSEGEPSHFVTQIQDITRRKQAEEARARLAAIVESSEAAIVSSTLDGTIMSWNAAAERLFGYPAEEALGQSGGILNPPERPVESLDAIRRLGSGGDTETQETVRLARDGSRLEVAITRSPIRDVEGSITGVSAIIHDISDRKEAERALADSEKRLKSAITGAPVIQFALDEEGIITLSEGKGLGVLGLEPGEGVGHSVFESYRRSPDVVENVRRALAGEEVAAMVEIGERSFDARYSPLREDDGKVTGVIGVATDITEWRELEKELSHRASHDDLTDLPNRTLFMDRISQALARAGRQGSVAVLFMDFDNFKVVNDSLGHEAGDRLLVAVAERLRGCLRASETVARLGGDEFAILVEDTDLEGAVGFAERVGETFRAPLIFGDARHEAILSVSTGVVMGDLSEGKGEDLIRKADVAMYRAKENGKARYELFDPQMDAQALRRLELANELRRAIEGGELRVYYQPKVALDSGTVIGFEALVRWSHPDRGLLLPEEFITVAEESGLILPLGRWVLWEACTQAKGWHDRYPHSPPLHVSVNLSAMQFAHPDLAEEVGEVLRESGLDPAALELEITESTIMRDTLSNIAILERLKSLGVRLAVDDFGTGYSSLGYLKRFPVDVLKIDRSMVEGLGRDPRDEAIVSAVIELAHALGQGVVGEGVEDAGQHRRLRELGCEVGQGYYFWEPLAAGEEIEPYLRDPERSGPAPG